MGGPRWAPCLQSDAAGIRLCARRTARCRDQILGTRLDPSPPQLPLELPPLGVKEREARARTPPAAVVFVFVVWTAGAGRCTFARVPRPPYYVPLPPLLPSQCGCRVTAAGCKAAVEGDKK